MKTFKGLEFGQSWEEYISQLRDSGDNLAVAAAYCQRACGAGSKVRIAMHLEDALRALDQEPDVAGLLARYGLPWSADGLQEAARRFREDLEATAVPAEE